MHTKGPWTTGTSCDGFLTVTDGTKTICTVGEPDIFPSIEHDARLIAAAPGLLAALRGGGLPILAWAQKHEHEESKLAYGALLHAERIIARAEKGE